MVASHAYYLIERTDNQTVPTVPADLVVPFGKGLSNSGETLQLKDASGGVVDTVAGGSDWTLIGGDNATKETAQRKPSGWVTAPSTPRASNGSLTPPPSPPVEPEVVTPSPPVSSPTPTTPSSQPVVALPQEDGKTTQTTATTSITNTPVTAVIVPAQAPVVVKEVEPATNKAAN